MKAILKIKHIFVFFNAQKTHTRTKKCFVSADVFCYLNHIKLNVIRDFLPFYKVYLKKLCTRFKDNVKLQSTIMTSNNQTSNIQCNVTMNDG